MQQMVAMLESNKSAFAYSLDDLPGYTGDPITFQLVDPTKRMFSPPRQYTEEELQFGDEKVTEMLNASVVKEIPTTNSHASCITLPMKRAPDGSWTDKRFCIDLRAVNANTVVDRFGMPPPEQLFRKLSGAKFLAKIDLRSGFWQLRLSEESQQSQVAFCASSRLQAAGITNGAVFVDDVVLWADTFEEHLEQLDRLFKRFIQVGLRAHPAKTVVAAQTIGYLGHLVSATECMPEEAKVAAIQALQPPTSVKRLQAHLGLCNYYRCYIPEFARMAQPLYQLLKKDTPFRWTPECQDAYDQLKTALCKPGNALRQPVPDRPFHLYVDWSSSGIAAVLHQRAADGTEALVACASRSLNQCERNYPAWKGEMLAAVWGVKMFRPYLHSREFFLHTDHRALLWLLTHKEPVGQQMRWILALQEYRFTLVHRKGATNPADVPSREPQSCLADSTGARLDQHVLDWPLPKILLSNGAPDSTVYDHDQLSLQLGIAAGAHQVNNAQSAAAVLDITPACVLAAELVRPISTAQMQHQVLHCLLASNDSLLDQQLPLSASLLGGGDSSHLSPVGDEHRDIAIAWGRQQLQRASSQWLTHAQQYLSALGLPPVASLPGRYEGRPDELGICPTLQLNTGTCAATFFPAAHSTGLVVWEPCGGICAGLEMALRNGFTVTQYYHSDIDPLVRKIAAHRILQLQDQYPEQLSRQAVAGCFTALPTDIRQITHQQLHQLVERSAGQQWLVVAGWPCQDFSLAGPSRGLRADRSQLLFVLVDLIGTLQQLQPELPPAYLLENVPFQHHRNQQIALQDYAFITSIIGLPVVLDAAQVGSFAHRVRNFWTNLCPTEPLATALQYVRRPPGRAVQQILPPHRAAQPVLRPDQITQYACNAPGQPRRALPTLMSRPGSYAFRPGQAGCIMDYSNPQQPVPTEPTAEERERALGYLPGSTAAAGVSEQQRCSALGQSMDANALQVLLSVAHVAWIQGVSAPVSFTETDQVFIATDPAMQQQVLLDTVCLHQPFSMQQAVCLVAETQEKSDSPSKGHGDVWLDAPVLQFLRSGALPLSASQAEKGRIQRRARNYYFVGEQLLRRMSDGSEKVVPPRTERQQLIQQQHDMCGHFGVRRTAAMLLTKYWWYGLQANVSEVVKHCEHCDRVLSYFNSNPEQLQSIPVSSEGFRWHVDLAGPFPKSQQGNTYVMIAVEAFTKHLEAVPIRNKESATVAYALLHNVIAKFGAPGQVVTDSGSEFLGHFQQLLIDCMIDHPQISTDHPQANGQAEKMVQTVKRALMKTCAAKKMVSNWDTEVAWISLGYRCTPQCSTHLSPYEMLYARKPVVPPAVASLTVPEVSYDDPVSAAKDLLLRKEALKQACPMALENLAIAQHRDQLRYLRVRDADYKPKIRHFSVGDFVYVQQLQRKSTLMPRAQPLIYRVMEIRDSGVLILQGKCGRKISMHMSHCAPCHLPGIDGSVDPRLAENTDDVLCEVCGTDEQESKLLICDLCTLGYHTFCLTPALSAVPAGTWLCPTCVQQGFTPADVSAREAEREALAERESGPVLFPDAAIKKRDLEAAAKHGRLVKKVFHINPVTKETQPFWGKVHYLGPTSRPDYTGSSIKMVFTPAPVQQAVRNSGPADVSIPCAAVPESDLQQLACLVSISVAQFCWDPFTCNQQWSVLIQSVPVYYQPLPSTERPSAGVILTSPAAPYLMYTIKQAMRYKPAALLCYVPTAWIPSAVWQLLKALKQQQRAAMFRAGVGWWLVISRQGLPVHNWLR
eukprot:gene6347-biopygen8143